MAHPRHRHFLTLGARDYQSTGKICPTFRGTVGNCSDSPICSGNHVLHAGPTVARTVICQEKRWVSIATSTWSGTSRTAWNNTAYWSTGIVPDDNTVADISVGSVLSVTGFVGGGTLTVEELAVYGAVSVSNSGTVIANQLVEDSGGTIVFSDRALAANWSCRVVSSAVQRSSSQPSPFPAYWTGTRARRSAPA